MNARDEVYFLIVFSNDEVTVDNVKKWINNMVFFTADKMRGSLLTKGATRKYNPVKFFNALKTEIESRDNFTLALSGNGNLFTVDRGLFYSHVSCFLQYEIYEAHKSQILNLINDFFQTHKSAVAFICSSTDSFWQNIEDISYYEESGKNVETLKLKKSPIFENTMIVDTEYNPGHSHFIEGLWFGSCWAMWFGELYYQFIPEAQIKSFQNCYENKELGNGSRRILLHENLWDYDKAENRERQWDFRKHTGMDEVAHHLENKGIEEKDKDVSIEILTGTFEHGGVRLIHYYYDEKGELIVKSKAAECRTYEMGNDGKVMWSEVRKL